MWTAIAALAHPPSGLPLAEDAHERLVQDVLAGPQGCWEALGEIRWAHTAGRDRTAGEARASWRLDHGVWRADDWTLVRADPGSVDVVIAPMLLGSTIDLDLRWPTSSGRTLAWPRPVATLPVRVWGEVGTVSVDELADGMRIVASFRWDGWKDVEGERSVRFGPQMAPRTARIDTTDRWRGGCRVRSVGEAALAAPGGASRAGLPTTEQWSFDGRCVLSRWTGAWTFVFSDWRPCSTSGPSPPADL